MTQVSSRTVLDQQHRFRLPSADPKAIADFQELWTARFGNALTEEEASRLATQVLHLLYIQNFGTCPGCTPRKLHS
jgi:hypothetical protein